MNKVIENILLAYSNGSLSKNMLKLKNKIEETIGKKLSPKEFAQYIYDKEVMKHKEATAGEQELANAFAYTCQEAKGGKYSDNKPFWLRVWDADTRLNYGGKPVELNEISHLVNLEQWKQDIPGFIAHNPESKVKLNNQDAKFDFENGVLSLYMNPSDKNIHKGLREGIIKPSIEVAFPEYMYNADDNMLKSYLKVNGLGLMEDGKQMGANVGPGEPNKTAVGGKDNMGEGEEGGEPTEAEKFQTELKSLVEKSPKDVLAKKDEYIKKYEGFKDEEFKIYPRTDFEKFIKDTSDDVDEDEDEDEEGMSEAEKQLRKENAEHRKALEEIKAKLKENEQRSKAKDEVLAKLEESLIKIELDNAKKEGIAKKTIMVKEDMTLDEIRARIEEVRSLKEAILDGVPEEEVDPFIKRKKKPLKDEKGNLSEEYYNTLNKELNPSSARKFAKPLKGYDPYNRE